MSNDLPFHQREMIGFTAMAEANRKSAGSQGLLVSVKRFYGVHCNLNHTKNVLPFGLVPFRGVKGQKAITMPPSYGECAKSFCSGCFFQINRFFIGDDPPFMERF
ncbi:MAG: hypothetical protein HY360_05585 [Verrucomicrobia bacterium]|nr:hypothetical protein [Verrucomicrobiota bacterium]